MGLLRSLDEKVDPARVGVIVIDMQNDFCASGGFLDHLGVDLGPIQAIVPRIRRLVDAARMHRVTVMHAYYDGDPAFFAAPMLERLERKNEAEPYCMPGTWGIEIVSELRPVDDEFIVGKHRYSAFFGTGLEMFLESKGIESLIVCGTATNNCVDGTARDAYYRGYYVVLPSDLSAAPTEELHQATLQTADHAYGVVCRSDEILAAWSRGNGTSATSAVAAATT